MLGSILNRRLAKKVPELTVYFWVIKVLTTGMGEATSDFFVHSFNPYIVVIVSAIVLALCLLLQLWVSRYIPSIYWLAVTMVAVFGTMAAGILHVYLGVPYIYSASIYCACAAVIFILWYLSERTLSVHSIYTRRREIFYWATVLATFALGTAVGDMTAVTFHLGFLGSGFLFTGLIVIPWLAYRFLGLNEIVAFWFAYVITRPLGASWADWLAVPQSLGGLNLGRGPVALTLTVLIAAFVVYLSVSHRDEPATRAA